MSEKILTSLGDIYDRHTSFSLEKPAGTQGLPEIGDNGHADRRLFRKLRALVLSDEFGEFYTPPNFSEMSYSHAEQEYVRKVNAERIAQGTYYIEKCAPMVTIAVLRKALLQFFDKSVFSCTKKTTRIRFSAFDANGDKYDFVFDLQSRRHFSRYDMSIEYNGSMFFHHTFTPDPDGSAEAGLQCFIENVEYDLKIFDTVIIPFIERERAVELELFANGGTIVHKGKRAPSACTADSTEEVSHICELIGRWFPLSRDMGEEAAANMIISMISALDDVNIPNRYGTTLLYAATFAETNIMPVLKFILDRKEINVNLGNGGPFDNYNKGDTPLHIAVERGEETVKLLLDHGADPNLVNAQGETPLVGASIGIDPAVVRLLVARGADPYIANDLGDNAFDIFVGFPRIIEELKKADDLAK